MFVLKIIRL